MRAAARGGSAFGAVVRFELRMHLRRASTWAFAAALALASAAFVALLGNEIGHHANAPGATGQFSFLLGMVGLVVTAALFGDAGSRDALTRMLPLFYTMPLRKHEYFLGRFAGALLVNALVLLAVPVGLAAGAHAPVIDPALVGPHQAEPYVRAYLLFLLPGLLISGSVLYATAALTRRVLPVFLALVGIAAAYFGAIAVGEFALDLDLGPILDPTGLLAVSRELRTWSPAEMNTRQLPLTGLLLWNRLLWVGLSLALLALAHRRFRFAHPEVGERGRAATRDRRVAVREATPTTAVPAPPPPALGAATAGGAASRAFDAPAQLAQPASVARRAFHEIVAARDFQVLALGLVAFVLASGWSVGSDRFGTPSWPVTATVARYLTSMGVAMVLTLLTVFYAGELTWRERDVNVADLTDAMPAPDWVPFAGKLGALLGMLLLLQGILMLAGIGLQLLKGFVDVEPWLYVRMLVGLRFPEYAMFAVLALLVHAAVDRKYLGHATGALLVLAIPFAAQFGLRHHLLLFGTDPGWGYSDLSGFEPYLPGVLAFKAYWLAWSVVLALAATLLWRRGRERGLGRRLRHARARSTPRLVAATAGALALVALTGGFVFVNTNVRNEYRTPETMERRRAEYERRYRHLQDAPRPRIASVSLRAELYPERREATVDGTYVLVNRTGVPIDSLIVQLDETFALDSLIPDRPSSLVTADRVHGLWIHALAAPLAPGDSLRLRFRLALRARGFANEGVTVAVVGNGSYFERDHMPLIGYQRMRELAGAEARRREGLAPRPDLPPAGDSAGRWSAGSSFDADLIDYEAVVGTAGDQHPVTAGALVRTWSDAGRRYVHHRAERPMPNAYAVLSARYAVRESVRDDLRLQVLHHPRHAFNARRLLDGAGRAFALFDSTFGRGGYREFRIAEFPRFGTYASAYPNLIAYSESMGFLARPDVAAGDIDTPLFVVAHEIAHAWWGGLVMPANVRGRSMLTETLANDAAILLVEQVHGPRAVRRFLRQQQIEYLNRRAREDSPLLETSDDPNVHYRKGAVAMYTLRRLLGDAAVNRALAALVSRFRDGAPPYATTLDLHRELLAVTPDSLRYALTDLLETVTIWDLRVLSARATPVGDGAYEVALEVEAGKFRVDSAFTHTEAPMDDLVQLGVFSRDAADETPLHLAWHRVRSGRQVITVRVDGEPAQAGIDPHLLLIARRGDDLGDNVRAVTREPSPARPRRP